MDLYSISKSQVPYNYISSTPVRKELSSPAKSENSKSPETSEVVTISAKAKKTTPHYKADFNKTGEELNQQELAQLQQLKRRDTEVRTHEQAHLSAAGQYARGGASFSYKKGPDGGSYAVGGEVGIDVAKESTPEATINKMRTIKRAALAPANPSGADKRIASQATAKEAQARQEILEIKQEELLQGESSSSPLTAIQSVGKNKTISTESSSYVGLKTKFATYSNLAENSSSTFSHKM